MEFPVRSAKARGTLIGSKTFVKVTHKCYLTEEELKKFAGKDAAPEIPEEEENTSAEVPAAAENAPVPEVPTAAEAAVNAPVPEVQAEEKKASAPSTAVSPEKVSAETVEKSDDNDTPLLGEVPIDPVESEKQPRTKKSEEKSSDSDDDLGIIQPEFGF